MSVHRKVANVTQPMRWASLGPGRSPLALLIGAMLALVLGGPVASIEAKPPANGQFDGPHDVATDSAGNVYVADQGNGRIQKFTSTGAFITKWKVRNPGKGLTNRPYDISVDTSGNVYVTVFAHHINGDFGGSGIQKFSANGGFIDKWGSFGTGSGEFDELSGVATDSTGYVYVTDRGGTHTENQRIQRFTSDGTFDTEWQTAGAARGQYSFPNGISSDASDSLYVSVAHSYSTGRLGSSSIQRFTADGVLVAKWGGQGKGPGRFGAFGPRGIAADTSGHVYVVDTSNNRIQKFTSSGAFVTKWGSKGSGNGQLDAPFGVATDPAGNVYVADKGNNRIQTFTSDGRFITKWGRGSRFRPARRRKALVIPANRRKAFFKPSCELAKRCRARVTIKAGTRILARGGYSIPAHGSRRVALSLTRAGRKALTRKRRVRAKLTIIDTRTRKREAVPVILRRR